MFGQKKIHNAYCNQLSYFHHPSLNSLLFFASSLIVIVDNARLDGGTVVISDLNLIAQRSQSDFGHKRQLRIDVITN